MADDCVTEIAERMCTTRYAPNNLHSLESIVERAIRMTIEATLWSPYLTEVDSDGCCVSCRRYASSVGELRHMDNCVSHEICARLRQALKAEKAK